LKITKIQLLLQDGCPVRYLSESGHFLEDFLTIFFRIW